MKEKARNYYILGRMAEMLSMFSEAATNYFKALFAVDDLAITDLKKPAPKDHTARFEALKANIPTLYQITDRLWNTYRRTYTQELNNEELKLARNRVEEAFKYAKIDIPTDEEIRVRFEEIIKNRKNIS